MARYRSRLAAALATALPAVCAATIDIAGISRDVSPCDDFYAYANHRATTLPLQSKNHLSPPLQSSL